MSFAIKPHGAWREFPLQRLIDCGLIIEIEPSKEDLDKLVDNLKEHIDSQILKEMCNAHKEDNQESS